MPPKKNVTISDAPSTSATEGSRSEIIVEFLEQLEICKTPHHLAEMIYADATEEPPSVEIPVEFHDLHDNLDSDDGSIDVATIFQATKILRQLCADRDRLHQKNLEAFLVRTVAANRASQSAASGTTAATGTTKGAACEERPVESGVEADEIMFAYDMSKPNFSDKDKRELEALVKDVSSFERQSELQRKIREHTQAFISRQAKAESDTLDDIFEIAGEGISDTSGAMGLFTNNAALESNTIPFYLSQATGNTSLRLRAKQDSVITRREPFRTDSEQAEIVNEMYKLALKGESDDLPKSYVERKGGAICRVFTVPVALELHVIARKIVQLRIAHAVIALLTEMSEDPKAKLRDDCKIQAKKLAEMLRTRDPYRLELDAPLTCVSLLYALLDRDVNSGSRALAILKHIFRERNPGIVDLRETGNILSSIKARKYESPQSFLQSILELGRSKKGMYDGVNWEAAGLTMIKGKDDQLLPLLLSDNVLANLALIDFACDRVNNPLCRDVNLVLTEEVMEKAHNIDYTLSEVQALLDQLDSKKIVHTPPKPADYVDPGDPGTSSSVDDSVGFIAVGGKGNGKGKGSKGKGGRGTGGGDRGNRFDSSSKPPRDASRDHSLVKGDISGVQLYARGAELLGSPEKFPFALQVLELIQDYFVKTVKKEPFGKKNGSIIIPPELNNGFVWRPLNKSAPNYGCRRDIYALWCLVRDVMVHKKNDKYSEFTLTNLGCEYKTSVPSWKALSADEFKLIYKPAKKSSFPFKPSKVQIRGEEVNLFTA